MSVIQQGDQYSLEVSILGDDGLPITPDGIDGVKIELGDISKRYPGELTFDGESDVWLFPVTQEETLSLAGHVKFQTQVNFGGTPPQILGSPKETVYVADSIIKEVWDD